MDEYLELLDNQKRECFRTQEQITEYVNDFKFVNRNKIDDFTDEVSYTVSKYFPNISPNWVNNELQVFFQDQFVDYRRNLETIVSKNVDAALVAYNPQRRYEEPDNVRINSSMFEFSCMHVVSTLMSHLSRRYGLEESLEGQKTFDMLSDKITELASYYVRKINENIGENISDLFLDINNKIKMFMEDYEERKRNAFDIKDIDINDDATKFTIVTSTMTYDISYDMEHGTKSFKGIKGNEQVNINENEFMEVISHVRPDIFLLLEEQNKEIANVIPEKEDDELKEAKIDKLETDEFDELGVEIKPVQKEVNTDELGVNNQSLSKADALLNFGLDEETETLSENARRFK